MCSHYYVRVGLNISPSAGSILQLLQVCPFHVEERRGVPVTRFAAALCCEFFTRLVGNC